jgi:hypothetical protein
MLKCGDQREYTMKRGYLIGSALWVCGAIFVGDALAADPSSGPLSPPSATTTPRKPLDLRVGDIRKYMTPEEFRALLAPADDSNTVVVKADAPLAPMRSELDVPGGLVAPFWALAHPTQAWRLFLPDARVDITRIPPPENKIPPPVFRWGP